MKKRVFSVCLLFGLVLFLAGCGPVSIRPQKESGTETAAGGRESSGIWFQPDVVPEEETNSGYYYSCLTEGEQRIYRQIYEAVREMNSGEIRLEGDDPERINDIYQYILYDHPELFWADYYNLYTYRMGERIQGYAFEGVYSLSPEEAAERKAVILEQAETILAEAPLGGSEYEKIRYVYEYIIRNTEYDREAPDNQNICSVFLSGRSVCQGYALAAQYLLNRMGIACVTVSGLAQGEPHAWNLVWADGEPYWMDVTWGDPQFTESGDGAVRPDPDYISYDYLLVTSAELGKTHTAESMYPLPVCTAVEDNYYIKEKMLFTEWDPEQFSVLLDRSLEEGTGRWTVRCAEEAVFQEIFTQLIENQEIYAFLSEAAQRTETGFATDRIQYRLDEERLQIQFCLLF